MARREALQNVSWDKEQLPNDMFATTEALEGIVEALDEILIHEIPYISDYL